MIPCKSQSERIPNKNSRLLAGKSLLDRALSVANESKLFSDIWVTSDSYSLLKRLPGFAQGHLRPAELATPTATVFDVCKDLLSVYSNDKPRHEYPPLPESFCVLLPTSPLRTAMDVQCAYEEFTEPGVQCLMSVSEYDYPPQWALELDYDNKYLGRWTWNEYEYPLTVLGYGKKYEKNGDIRQNLKPLYKHNGSIIIAKTQAFLEVNDWYNMNITPWHTPKGEEIDIDTQDQWDYAEYLLRGK